MTERTLSMIKPNAVAAGNVGNILHHAVRKLSFELRKAGCLS